jgi:methyl-CpG-binding domain protein 4
VPEVEGLLLQEVYADDPWRLLVCCILLNQTTRRQVDGVRGPLFERWPTAMVMAYAFVPELTERLKPLGLQNRRAAILRDMSSAWVVYERLPNEGMPPPEWYVASLPGVGEYALDSYRIFVLKDISRFCSGDKEIRAWAERSNVTLGLPPEQLASEGSEDAVKQIPPLRGGI